MIKQDGLGTPVCHASPGDPRTYSMRRRSRVNAEAMPGAAQLAFKRGVGCHHTVISITFRSSKRVSKVSLVLALDRT